MGSTRLDFVFYSDLTSIRGWGCDQVRLPKGPMSLDTVIGSGTGLGLGCHPGFGREVLLSLLWNDEH